MSRDLGGILARHRNDPTRLVQILRDVMEADGWISPPAITALADGLGLPRARVEGVAGFYAFFATEPRGRYRVLFSDNITDEMAGSVELRQRLLDAFHVRLGEVSRDGLVSIDVTSCTGLCDQGPALLVNGRAIPRLTHARIGAIAAMIRGGAPLTEWPDNLFEIHEHVERQDVLVTTPFAPGEALGAALARGPEATLGEVERSLLRGRGGAGFPTGQKWRLCREAPGERYVVCNADEGEPGTFKDRFLLARHADLVLEGMTVAAFAVGAQKGLLYLRAEYPFLLPGLEAALARRRREGLLGERIRGAEGFDFDIEIHVGAGAYVCGEESALLSSLEGERGIPRNRPPYPVTHGYLQRPTAVNNVETLAKAALVARHGADWLRSRGTGRSTGTKLLSVSGDVARPGIYEYPFGVAVKQVLEDAGARRVQAVQVGGPSGTLLAHNELERRIAFEDVPCAGAFMVFDESRDMIDVLHNFARFFAHESCGFCTPCRVGTTLERQMLSRITSGKGTRKDVKDLGHVARLMKAASHCGLGTTAGNAVLDAFAKFKPSFDRRLASLDVLPVFDLDESLAEAREVTGRDDVGAHFPEEP
ncbi:MAG: NAD(P)H-dependent oxidoreductase subunit E [Polyangiaceae bacterium]|nr:NAD(P)H-dependent oxidoreductase subunit E [Polyangiaceae bacterium]